MMLTIGVIGQGHRDDHPVPAATLAAAEEVGRGIAEAGAVLVSGGLHGVMDSSSKGAKLAGGFVIGFIPGMDRAAATPYLDICITTGMGTIRNIITARGCDALIMVGGGAGTLNELTIAYSQGRPVVVLEGSGGWADRIRAALVEGKYLDERRTVEIEFAQSPAEAVSMAMALARTADQRVLRENVAGWNV
jgi:uncharacterized protein (TIGR00725 family)